MSFDTWIYALFLPVVLAGAYVFPFRAQNRWLLAASLFFYGWWDWRFLLLLVFTAMLDFAVAIRIEEAPRPARKRTWLVVSLVANLGVLACFKYFNFFSDSAARLLALVGADATWTTLEIVLPVGISFYTFQTMSYTIDVYRGRLPASRDPVAYGLFVSFFPQLVAGPIERATNLLPQVERPRIVTETHWKEGAFLILLGLFKKVALADAIAPLVDATWSDLGHADPVRLWRAMYLFTFQIYLDFAGYSDIARGSAKLLGFELMENFRQPFFAARLADLWRRWHVSLSTWLRDYLYLPLGGSRGGSVATARNLIVTMTLSGLWHGARWTFVVWGFLHGVLLVAERFLLPARSRIGSEPRGAWARILRILGALVVFHLLALLFVFFRAPGLAEAVSFFAGMNPLGTSPSSWSGLYLAAWYGALILAVDLVPERGGHPAALLSWPAWARGTVFGIMIIFVFAWSFGREQPFIYFQF